MSASGMMFFLFAIMMTMKTFMQQLAGHSG
jgi:hypothetical protein